MYRRAAAAAAIAVSGLVAAAPVAAAGVPTPTPSATDTGGNGNVQLLNGVNVLPVQACGLQVPLLSGILQAPDGKCAVGNDGAHVNGQH